MIEFYNENQTSCYPLKPKQNIPDDVVVDLRLRLPYLYSEATISKLVTGDVIQVFISTGGTDLLCAVGSSSRIISHGFKAMALEPLVPGVWGNIVLGTGAIRPAVFNDLLLGTDAIIVSEPNGVTSINSETGDIVLETEGITTVVSGTTAAPVVTLTPKPGFTSAMLGCIQHRPPVVRTIMGVGPEVDPTGVDPNTIYFVFD
jgi:hypothetical protein